MISIEYKVNTDPWYLSGWVRFDIEKMLSPYYEVLVNEENIEGNLQPLVHTSGNSWKERQKQQKREKANNDFIRTATWEDRKHTLYWGLSYLLILSSIGFVVMGGYRAYLHRENKNDECQLWCIILLIALPAASVVSGCMLYCLYPRMREKPGQRHIYK